MYLNKVIICGNLTRDPELRAMPSGSKVASFSLATNSSYKDKNGVKQDRVEYHNIITFGSQAETSAQYLRKGQQALIEGRLQTRSWDDKDGTKKYRTEIVADRVQFGPRPGAQNRAVDGNGPQDEIDAETGEKKAPQAKSKEKKATAQSSVVPDSGFEYPTEEINPADIPF